VDSAKTGSIRIGQHDELEMDDRLPEGDIRWGFLHMDSSSGQFKIDQKMVESHATELRQQLQRKSKSIIDWIQGKNFRVDLSIMHLTLFISLELLRRHLLQLKLWKSFELLRARPHR
jgi:hypothetical protein